jgi:hypothetical protein
MPLVTLSTTADCGLWPVDLQQEEGRVVVRLRRSSSVDDGAAAATNLYCDNEQ